MTTPERDQQLGRIADLARELRLRLEVELGRPDGPFREGEARGAAEAARGSASRVVELLQDRAAEGVPGPGEDRHYEVEMMDPVVGRWVPVRIGGRRAARYAGLKTARLAAGPNRRVVAVYGDGRREVVAAPAGGGGG
jgi:hypothetical protein